MRPSELFIVLSRCMGLATCTCTSVHLRRDRVDDTLDLGEFLFEVFRAGRLAVGVDPVVGVFDGGEDCLFIFFIEL